MFKLTVIHSFPCNCHIALGKAYPATIKDGVRMSAEQLKAAGANDALNHVDVMFGSDDMHIVGYAADGSETIIFDNGEYLF